MTYSIEHYWPFSLFALLPLIFILWYYSLAGLQNFRKYGTLILRVLLLSLLILMLADISILYKSRLLTVCMLVDRSGSISTPDQSEQFLIQQIKEMNPKDERVTVWTFTEEPYSELQDHSEKGTFHRFETEFSSSQQQHTNIEKALKIALATMPEKGEHRLVLMSDGNQTTGDCLSQIAFAKERKIPIDVYPLNLQQGYGKEIIFEKLVAPQNVYENRPYKVQAIIHSNQTTQGTIHLTLNNTVIGSHTFDLNPGKNQFEIVIPGPLVKTGYQNISAILECPRGHDTIFNNNSSQAFSYANGTPKILFLDSDMEHSKFIPKVLEQAQQAGQKSFNVTVAGARDCPRTMMELALYDIIILSNVHSENLGKDTMLLLESAVKEDGLGLIMIGGENSFGAGGYRETPIEKILPVYMDIKHKKVIPSGALAIILHTCEFPDGNGWAKRITHKAIDLLSDADYVGALDYSYNNQDGWIFPMTLIGNNRSTMHGLLDRAEPSDMPDFTPTLNAAYKGLQKTPATKKHIVIISDGDPSPPSSTLINQIQQNKISISCVAICPHGGDDIGRMRFMAEKTGGRYYHTNDASDLPGIFTKETLEIRRNLLIESIEGLPVTVNHTSDLIRGISRFPKLYGYVATTAKPEAQVPLYIIYNEDQDPLLAHWQCGLGRTVVFTSDAKNRWARDWVGTPEFAQFWLQTARWVQRKIEPSEFQIHSSIENNQVKVAIDAVNKEGDFVNLLNMQGTARIIPLGSNLPITQHFIISQAGPGRYTGEFPMLQPGLCVINVQYLENAMRKQLRSGFYINQASEYTQFKPNIAILQQMAEQTGGRFLYYSAMDQDLDGKISFANEWIGTKADFDKLDLNASGFIETSEHPKDEKIFLHGTPQLGSPTPLWPYFLQVFVCLFVLDIALRRVMVDYQKIWQKVWFWKASAISSSDEGVKTSSRLLENKEKRRAKSSAHKGVNLDELESLGKKSEPKQTPQAALKQTSQTIPQQAIQQTPTPSSSATISPKTHPQTKIQSPQTEQTTSDNIFTNRLLEAKKKTHKK